VQAAGEERSGELSGKKVVRYQTCTAASRWLIWNRTQGVGGKFTRGAGVTTNSGTNPERLRHHPMANMVEGALGKVANQDANPKWVNYHPTANTARKDPVPGW
jgi:hypothetical protein